MKGAVVVVIVPLLVKLPCTVHVPVLLEFTVTPEPTTRLPATVQFVVRLSVIV